MPPPSDAPPPHEECFPPEMETRMRAAEAAIGAAIGAEEALFKISHDGSFGEYPFTKADFALLLSMNHSTSLPLSISGHVILAR